MNNPYTLVFGQPPAELVEREPQMERIISEFCSERPSNYINLITGIRGSGKTVFMTEVADRLKSRPGWIVINLNPQRELLTALASRLNSQRKLNKLFQAAEINLEFFGIGIGIKTAPPLTDIEEALSRMFECIQKDHQRVLITLDEVTNSREMRIFTSAFQIFLRERFPVFLLMTGLHKHIDSLRNADGMTFLERAPRTVLGPLNHQLMTEKYMAALQIGQDQASRLARQTCGYSFAFQVIGYFFFENRNDVKQAENRAREYLCEFAYKKIWSELSGKDRELLRAVADTPSGKIVEIRKKLNYTTNQFNPYRNRMIKAGILTGEETGFVFWALPFFDQFIMETTVS